MENLAPFRQGHSGNPLNVITTLGRFRMDFFDDWSTKHYGPSRGGGGQKQISRRLHKQSDKKFGLFYNSVTAKEGTTITFTHDKTRNSPNY